MNSRGAYESNDKTLHPSYIHSSYNKFKLGYWCGKIISMKPGYIYISSNKSHIGPLLKIGFTTRNPRERVREFFSGKTSVPEEFILDFSCSVHDCIAAERQIHSALNSYRHKHNREFFIVKATTAKILIVNTCTEINQLYGVAAPIIDDYTIKTTLETPNRDRIQGEFIFYADPRRFSLPTRPQSILNSNQRLRVGILHDILNEADPESLNSMIKGFEMDMNPENEIKVYEIIAKEYCKISSVLNLKNNQLREL